MAQLNDDLDTIKSARDSMKTALASKGQTVTKDIRTYANAIANIPAGGGGAKMFDSVEEMQSDSTIATGDYAVVYENLINSWTETTSSKIIVFPSEVVLSESPSGSISEYIGGSSGGNYANVSIRINRSRATFRAESSTGLSEYINYTSRDGLTYTKSSAEDTTIEFPVDMSIQTSWNDIIGDFLKVGNHEFNGFYEAKTDVTVDNTELVKVVNIPELDNGNVVYQDKSIKASDIKTILNKTTFFSDSMNYKVAYIIYSNGKYYIYPMKEEGSVFNLLYSTTEKTLRIALIKGNNNYGSTKNPAEFFVYDTSNDSVTINTDNNYNTQVGFWSSFNLYFVDNVEKSTNTYYIKYHRDNDKLECSGIMRFSGTNPSNNVDWLFPENNYKTTYNTYYAPISLAPDINFNYNYMKITGTNTSDPSLFLRSITGFKSGFTLDFTDGKNIGYLFNGASHITSIPTITGTSSVIIAMNTFAWCSNLKEIPLLELPLATNVKNFATDCTLLETVPEYNLPSVTLIDDMFKNCPALTNESLNNIMLTCLSMNAYIAQGIDMTLAHIGLSSTQATACQSLDAYSDFIAAGWTTGY